jgi:glutathione S-transferase
MFAAEKGCFFSETETVDLMGGANRQEPFLSKNPAGTLPCVELDDGSVISETIAICELLEDLNPEPALIGANPTDRAVTRMWVRRLEWKIIQPLTDGFRNAEGIELFKSRFRTDATVAPFLKAVAQDGISWLDEQLAGRDFIVPDRFSLADVALFAFAEFGKSVGQSIDPAQKNVAAWFDRIQARESTQA